MTVANYDVEALVQALSIVLTATDLATDEATDVLCSELELTPFDKIAFQAALIKISSAYGVP